uniref:Protein artemis n=1 Tax=Mastacembelus armatus TaxID=205130 RepID=A0A7N8Y9I3_9TELE
MSSFAGRMREYPTISLDRFDRENLYARAYFLSHCHKDHMKGLKGPLLKRKLQFSRTVRLYCSFVTKELLLNNPKYAFWEEYIVSPFFSSQVVVTLLPAGHCPGSVMFLFEGSRGNVLYTGDFRLATGDAPRIEYLHSGSRVKDIQSVYVDSTFYDPRYYKIPTREVCLNGISELVGNWIRQSPYHVVWLNCKAAYGYEYLFTNLGEQFNTQIHVNSLAMFIKMPEILSYVTTDRRTQIHACRHPKNEEYSQGNRMPCGCTTADGIPLRIISIKPSTMWFGERSRKTNVIIKTGASSYRACFSFHSSYSEIKDFLSYLQPVNVYPNVIPIGRTLNDVTQLKLMCRSRSDLAALVYKPLGVLKRSRVEQPTYDSDSDNELFEGLDLVPMKKKVLNQEVENDGEEQKEQEEVIEGGEMRETQQEKKVEDECKEPSSAPKWEEFFTVETLTDSQNSLNSQSQSCRSATTPSPSRMTDSQTPELFSEEETPDENFSLSLSASLSNHSSQNMDSYLPDTLILQPEQRGREQGDAWTSTMSGREDSEDLILPVERSESQVSSDFDIPCTPESKVPQPEELLQLYRKLASGEEVVIRKGSQGSA